MKSIEGEMPRGSVLVVGFRVTGRAVAGYLSGLGESIIIVEDDPTDERRHQAAALGAEFLAHPDEDELRRGVAASRLVVPSPGIPVRHPVYRLAAEAGIPVHSELELGWERLERRPADARRAPLLVAVTGTNGKTTVCTLVAAMLVESGLVAVAAGNIGLPFIEAVALNDAALDVDVLVVEVSSFQLQFTDRFHPAVSCWLNLAEDHLDWHPTMAHYAAAKARIWAAQGAGDMAILNEDDHAVMAAAAGAAGGIDGAVRRVTFSMSPGGDYHVARRSSGGDVLVGLGGQELLAVSELPRSLPFDVANALAAVATALAAGATLAGCRAGLRHFPGLPHRVELVAEHDGVRWYDDSKSTTPASVLAAVGGFASVVLIAGGRNKGLDLTVLAQTAPPVRAVVAIGEAAAEVESAFKGSVPVAQADDMAAAVSAAAAAAVPGDVVLLSPGCASFDWYHSYAERGEEFTSLVTALVGAGRHRVGHNADNDGSST